MTTTSLEQLRKELRDMRRQAEQLTQGLAGEQIGRRPAAAQWSIAECLFHLNLAAASYQPRIAEAIEHGKERGISGEGPFRLGLFGRLLRSIAEPPPKFKLPAPKSLAPAAHPDPAEVVADFMRLQDGWEQLMKKADGLNMAKVKVGSPLRSLPSLRLCAIFAWMFAHQRRHLWQAENVKRQLHL